MSEQIADYEVQLQAMRAVMAALTPLDTKGREAVLQWVDSQLGRQKTEAVTPEGLVPIPREGRVREGTVSVVAQRLGAKSARDLLLAAAVHLTLFQGKESFTRDELVACAKDARGWKADYSTQIAINIKRMLGAGTLFEKARDVFSLAEATEKEMQTKMAG
jgi:hypothetical protein